MCCTFVEFSLFILSSEDAQRCWQEEILTDARKGIVLQATKGLRVESQVPKVTVLVESVFPWGQ